MRPALGGVTGGLSGPGDPPGRAALRLAGARGAARRADPRHGRDPHRAGRAAVRAGRGVARSRSAPRCSTTRRRRCGCWPSWRRALAERGFAAVADAIGYAHRDAGVESSSRRPRRAGRPDGCRWWPGPSRAGGSARRTGDPAVALGARLDAAVAARGPLCVGIDPHAAAAARLGPAGRRVRAGAVRADLRSRRSPTRSPWSSRSRRSSSGSAPRDRGPGAGAGRGPGRRRAEPARRQARRHRLDDGRRTPAPTCDPASPLAADAITVSPYLGFGSLQPAARRCVRERARSVRARADLQPGGRRPCSARWPPTGGPSPRRSSTRCGGQRGRGRPARVGRRGRRRDRRRTRPPAGPPARAGAGPGPRRAGRGRRPTCPRCSARRCRWVLPAASREVLGAGPDPVRLRAATDRIAAEVMAIRTSTMRRIGRSVALLGQARCP